MSRKKAIERAWKCDCDEQGCTGKYLPKVAAERGYDAGRIAGLREAERWVRAEAIDRSDGTFVMLTQLAKAIGKLAKKARKRDE